MLEGSQVPSPVLQTSGSMGHTATVATAGNPDLLHIDWDLENQFRSPPLPCFTLPPASWGDSPQAFLLDAFHLLMHPFPAPPC